MAVNDAELLKLLQESKTIVVVGLSPKEDRPSYRVAAYMQRMGYRIIPVNPGFQEILGEKCYPSLEAIPAAEVVDIVDVFRRGEDTPPIAQEAVPLKPKALWLQSGITNEESMAIARQGGMLGIEDKCLMVEHRRLLG